MANIKVYDQDETKPPLGPLGPLGVRPCKGTDHRTHYAPPGASESLCGKAIIGPPPATLAWGTGCPTCVQRAELSAAQQVGVGVDELVEIELVETVQVD
jgi:hypothetical protein